MRDCVVVIGTKAQLEQAISVEMASRGHVVIAITQEQKCWAPQSDFLDLVERKRVYLVNINFEDQRARKKILENFNNELLIKYLIHCSSIEPSKSFVVMDPQAQLLGSLQRYFTSATRVLWVDTNDTHSAKFKKKLPTNPVLKPRPQSTGIYFSQESLPQSQKNFLVGHLDPGQAQSNIAPQFRTLLKNSIKSTNPDNLALIARFTGNVLENTADEDFVKSKWDYYDQEHQNITNNPAFIMGKKRAKL